MTATAITFLCVSVGTLWGGLTWSLLRLRRYPDLTADKKQP